MRDSLDTRRSYGSGREMGSIMAPMIEGSMNRGRGDRVDINGVGV